MKQKQVVPFGAVPQTRMPWLQVWHLSVVFRPFVRHFVRVSAAVDESAADAEVTNGVDQAMAAPPTIAARFTSLDRVSPASVSVAIVCLPPALYRVPQRKAGLGDRVYTAEVLTQRSPWVRISTLLGSRSGERFYALNRSRG